ncbi:hypothetical protein CDAR_3341 [Caerostris darwini]|uniref:C2H2-type domain-containing protein n=1 Tax=Caerostris darwini TaxID=1538125 RepID=A0AAV4QUL4_9ARAC|nr:hypothetical protein CDAR_3341 [Caerostris darwini]
MSEKLQEQPEFKVPQIKKSFVERLKHSAVLDMLRQEHAMSLSRRKVFPTFSPQNPVDSVTLVSRTRLFTGEKRFVCDKCPKSFTSNQNLKYHKIMTHYSKIK